MVFYESGSSDRFGQQFQDVGYLYLFIQSSHLGGILQGEEAEGTGYGDRKSVV
jgi:hypothetical protein